MGILNKETAEVMAAFQRYIKSGDPAEIEAFGLAELRLADTRLGNRDIGADFRLAIQNRIADIEAASEKTYQSKVRVIGYVVAFAIGVLSTLLVQWITKYA